MDFDEVPTPQLHGVEQLSEGWINKYELTYELPDGSFYTYESVSRKGFSDYVEELMRVGKGAAPRTDAVCIVPRTENDELVLIREFRYPINSWCIAFPAGLKEPDEDIIDCVTRELHEETGYRVKTLFGNPRYRPLDQPGYSSTGMSEESVQVVYAYVEKSGKAEPEPSEFIEVFTLRIANIPRFLKENKTPIGTRCQLILESFAHDQHWDQCG